MFGLILWRDPYHPTLRCRVRLFLSGWGHDVPPPKDLPVLQLVLVFAEILNKHTSYIYTTTSIETHPRPNWWRPYEFPLFLPMRGFQEQTESSGAAPEEVASRFRSKWQLVVDWISVARFYLIFEGLTTDFAELVIHVLEWSKQALLLRKGSQQTEIELECVTSRKIQTLQGQSR